MRNRVNRGNKNNGILGGEAFRVEEERMKCSRGDFVKRREWKYKCRGMGESATFVKPLVPSYLQLIGKWLET